MGVQGELWVGLVVADDVGCGVGVVDADVDFLESDAKASNAGSGIVIVSSRVGLPVHSSL